MKEKTWDSIVVGGGIAGLTAAAYLARAGQQVLLLEQNEVCGGLVNTFRRNGFAFDAGVRALEDAGIIFPMLADLGITLPVVPSPVSVGVGQEVLDVKDIASLAGYRDLLIRHYPDSREEIGRLIKTIRRIMKHMDVLYGIENPVFKDLVHDRAFVLKKLLPWLPRFLFTVGKINRMQGPVEHYLDRMLGSRPLRDIVSQHFFRDTPTFFAMSYFSLYLDYFYPVGGMGSLAAALEAQFLKEGGELQTGIRVTELNPALHRITDSEGRSYAYNSLVWAADLKTLYRQTDTGGLSAGVRQRFEQQKAKMLAARGGDSVYSLFLEVGEDPESFRRIAHGHFFYTPLKDGLGEVHREELRALLRRPGGAGKEELLEWLGRFVRLNTYEISVPCLKDPTLAPAGKTGLIVSFLADYDLFSYVKEAGWYEEFREVLADRVLEVLAGSIYPMLKDRVLNRYAFTPLSYAGRTGSSEGAITGWSFEQPVPVIRRIQHSARSVLTPLPDVYQAGQWAYSPAGVPMSILTGRLAAGKIGKGKRRPQ